LKAVAEHLPTFAKFMTRRWMAAVAIIGIALGITIERHGRFRRIAAQHRGDLPKLLNRTKPFVMEDQAWRLFEWHRSMALKYEHATRYPWLPLAPDPPLPCAHRVIHSWRERSDLG
jgi:hypothetical protein